MKETMNGLERTKNILQHKKVDRIGIYEHFWNDTRKEYLPHMKEGESLNDHFNLDIAECWALNLKLDLDFVDKVVAETEDTVTILDGNGAYLRRHKHHDTTPEHIGYTIKDGDDWAKIKDKFKEIDERRINFAAYRAARDKAKRDGKFFTWSGVNVFEAIHPLVGHENMLIGMASEPEWVIDMAETYARQLICLQEILFAKEGKPDGVWYYEDMGYKDHPFMSPAMYREIIQPSHKATIDFAKSQGLPVIMHSCGYIRPLLPYMIEAGIDCLQVIEIKAGMDLIEIYKSFGEKIALMGGIDVRKLYTNDKATIDKELESKIPIVKEGYGFCVHSDHSIPRTVKYETLQYYFEKARSLGWY